MSPEDPYFGPERRKFRRLVLHYPVRIELQASKGTLRRPVVEGVTENLSFGGALVGVADASCLPGATPVIIYFADRGRTRPSSLTAVVWRRADEPDIERHRVAVEFDVPLFAYEGAVEVADRLQWLREMGGEAFMRDNVERFLDSVPPTIRAAQDACSAGDLDAVAQLARSLKSNAGNIGAVNLYEVARRAEQAAREPNAAAAARFVKALQMYYEAIRSELDTDE